MSDTSTCPVCTEAGDQTFLAKVNLGFDTDFDLLECKHCEVRFLDPMATPQQLEAFYSPQYYGSDWYKQLGLGMAFARSTLRGLKPGLFLDVGCGPGYFIKGIRENSDWRVQGVEFSEEASAHARQELDLDVKAGQLKDAAYFAKSFDYIHIRNVLEHVVDPRELMQECRRIIKGDGRLQLLVPNGPVDSANLINYFEQEGRSGISGSGHLFFFSQSSLEKLFEDTGFEIARARTYGIRRGLAALGKWPRKDKWKRQCAQKLDSSDGDGAEISLPPGKARPDIYYRYRHFRMNAKMLPGMSSIGLDFDLILKPI